jgi:hypothetical protein
MRGISYLRSTAGLAPKRVRVLQPPQTPAWELAGIPPAERPSEPDSARRPSTPSNPAAPRPEKPRTAQPTAGFRKNFFPAPPKASVIESSVQVDARKPLPHASQSSHSQAVPESPARVRMPEPIVESRPEPAAPVKSTRADERIRPAEPTVGLQPRVTVPTPLVINPQAAAKAPMPTPDKTNHDQQAPPKSVGKPESQPASVPAPMSGFAQFAKAAMESRWQPPVANSPVDPDRVAWPNPPLADPDGVAWPDPPLVAETRKTAGPERNTVHIGQVEIQIVPPPESPRRSAPRPVRQTTILSRGFPAWYGLKQG